MIKVKVPIAQGKSYVIVDHKDVDTMYPKYNSLILVNKLEITHVYAPGQWLEAWIKPNPEE